MNSKLSARIIDEYERVHGPGSADTTTPPEPASVDTRQVIEQLRRMKYSDSADFRALCSEYASKHDMTVEAATALLKPICDSRE